MQTFSCSAGYGWLPGCCYHPRVRYVCSHFFGNPGKELASMDTLMCPSHLSWRRIRGEQGMAGGKTQLISSLQLQVNASIPSVLGHHHLELNLCSWVLRWLAKRSIVWGPHSWSSSWKISGCILQSSNPLPDSLNEGSIQVLF